MTTVTDLQRKDYAGNLLPVSGAFTKLVTGTSAAEALSGTAGNDVFQAGAGDTLSGGAGDDTYVVQYRDQVVIEKPGQGVDTVKTTSSYILPDNVENLYASGLPIVSGASVTGNSQANIIIGDSNPQIIAGAGGNDVLTGGGGSDTFLFGAGSGHDVISDFQTGALAGGGDVLRLQDYTLKGLSDLKAAMTQVGADVVLKLSSTDDVTFRNVKVGDFTAANFQPALDRSQLKLAFGDEFSAATLDLKTASNPDGKWTPEFGFGGIGSKASHFIGMYTGEQNIYVDPSYKGSGKTALGLDPFQLDSGILTINSGVIPDADKSALYGHIPYYSGMLRATSGQTYGYFEMRAQFPSQSGSWPAFWLTPAANASREIDIFEHYGNEDYIRTTVHDTALANGATGQLAYVPDSTTAFHTYGMKWTAQTLTWYVDGQQVFQTATPADMNGPMYMNINLPLGSVAGVVDPNNMPAGYKIDYVRAYSLTDTPQLPDPQPAPQPSPAPVPSTSLTASANTLVANLASYAANTALQSITVSDKAPLTLSLAQMTQYASVLDKIAGGYSLAVSDTAANVTAALDSLQANSRVGTIQLTDTHVLSVGSIAAMQGLIGKGAQVLAKIAGGYSLVVSDTAANVTAALDSLQANPLVSAIQLTDTHVLSVGSIAAMQGLIGKDAQVLAKIAGGYSLAVSDTAANVTAALDSLQTNPLVSTIQLTDTHVLSVGSVATMQNFLRQDAQALAKIAGGYSFAVSQTKGDLNQTTSYDATGHLTATTTSIFSSGVLKSQGTIFADGSSDTKLYTNGVLTSEFVTHADKSKDVFLSALTGKTYVAEHDSYNSAGVLTEAARTHTDSSLDYHYVLASDGTKTTDQYDASSVLKSHVMLSANGASDTQAYANVGGQAVLASDITKFAPGGTETSNTKFYATTSGQAVLTSETQLHADKSKDVFLSALTGKTYVAEHDSYNSAGVLTEAARTHTDSSLDYHYVLASDGTKTTDQYDASSVLKSHVMLSANGASDTQAYANVGGQAVLASDITKFASGGTETSNTKFYATTSGQAVLTSETQLHADKSKDVFLSNITGKTYVAEHDSYDVNGKFEFADQTKSDGSHAQTAYQAGQTLISHAGVTDLFKSFGGDAFVFASGFGKDTITGFHAGSANDHDTLWLDNSQVKTFAEVQSHLTAVGADTLLTLSSTDTLLLKNVQMASLKPEDFHFQDHGLFHA